MTNPMREMTRRIVQAPTGLGQRLLLLVLALESDVNGCCQITQKELSELLGTSERSVQRYTHELETLGYLNIVPSWGEQGERLPNHFQLRAVLETRHSGMNMLAATIKRFAEGWQQFEESQEVMLENGEPVPLDREHDESQVQQRARLQMKIRSLVERDGLSVSDVFGRDFEEAVVEPRHEDVEIKPPLLDRRVAERAGVSRKATMGQLGAALRRLKKRGRR